MQAARQTLAARWRSTLAALESARHESGRCGLSRRCTGLRMIGSASTSGTTARRTRARAGCSATLRAVHPRGRPLPFAAWWLAIARMSHTPSLPRWFGLLSLLMWLAAAGRRAPGVMLSAPGARQRGSGTADLRSQDGVLRLDLTIHNVREPDGSTRYCYLLPDGTQSPTLRLHPGEQLVLMLHNALTSATAPGSGARTRGTPPACTTVAAAAADPCSSGAMTPTSTNLHFHGLTVPPRVPPGRGPEDLDPAAGRALRISLPHPRQRAAGPVLVPPAHSRFSSVAGARRRLRRADHRGPGARRIRAVRGPARARAGHPRSGSAQPRRAAFEVRAASCRRCSSIATATRPTTAPASASRRRTCPSTSCRCPTPTTRRRRSR